MAAIKDPAEVFWTTAQDEPEEMELVQIPLDKLRRLIAFELKEAADMAAKVFPSWKSGAEE
jgi:hypothetical protein